MINTEHPKYKELSTEKKMCINTGHLLREYLEKEMKQDIGIIELKDTYNKWFENEKNLQKLWGFPEDENYIRWWWVPKCTCPKLDNDDNYPIGYYTTSMYCPLRGNQE